MILLGVLAAAGVAALVGLAAGRAEPSARWGYAAATLAFLLSTAQAAPPLALATRLTEGHWGVPFRRVAELWAVAGLVTAPMFVLLLFQLPEWQGRPSIWFDWPGAPRVWDSLVIVLFAGLGLALVYLGNLPDLAAARNAAQASSLPGAGSPPLPPRGRGGRGGERGASAHGQHVGDGSGSRLLKRLALGWTGTARQWRVLTRGVVVLGALYLMSYVFVHVLVVSDLAMSLVPGWKSAVIPPYHAVSGLQAGVATAILTLAALRRAGGPARDVGIGAFESASKVLLALSLIWFWFAWSEFLTYWYGRTPEERWLLELLMFGPYLGHFLLAFALNALLPFLLLIWNPVRASVGGPALAAALVLVGNLVDRVRIYVAAWSVAAPVAPARGELPPLPPAVNPTLPDILIVLGLPALVVLLLLLALRVVPGISGWETGAVVGAEGRASPAPTAPPALRAGQAPPLPAERRYLETEAAVVGRGEGRTADAGELPELTPARINRDLLRFSFETPRWFWGAAAVLGLVVGAGGVSVLLMIAFGLGLLGYTNTQMWAVLITTFVFWVGISHAGVMISAVLRLTHAEWRRPITRAAEVLTIFSLMVAALFPVIHSGRMWRTIYWSFPYDFSRGLWPSVRSALIWDVTAILTYLIGTVLFVYVSLVPDLAAAHDGSTGWRRRFYGALALGFRGSVRQWRLQQIAGLLLSALILPVFVSVHSTVAWDFGMAILPGWHSTIFGPYFVIGAVHSGVAAMVVVMAVLRRVFRLGDYIRPEHFEAMGRLQVIVALTWLFFFLMDLYFGLFGREAVELRVWELRLFTPPYSILAVVFFLAAFVIPFPLWLSRRVRCNPAFMLVLGLLVNVGMWLERYLLVVPPLSYKQPFVFTWVGAYQPRLIEYILVLASFAFVALGILLFAKLFPIVPLWDVKEGELLKQELRVGRAVAPAAIRE